MSIDPSFHKSISLGFRLQSNKVCKTTLKRNTKIKITIQNNADEEYYDLCYPPTSEARLEQKMLLRYRMSEHPELPVRTMPRRLSP